jgi:hypothetical protein
MTKKYQVFISSTLSDLKEEREAITRSVIDMGLIASGMESFPANQDAQFRYIQRVIDLCDYYLLVLGARYGSLNKDGISFTEAEFDYAQSQGKCVLAFVHSDPSSFSVARTDRDANLMAKFEAFRDRVTKDRLCRFWGAQGDLINSVVTSLHQATQESPGIGWVRGDFRPETPPALPQHDEQRSRLFRLENDFERLQKAHSTMEAAVMSAFLAKTKPATDAEVAAWVEGAKNHYPGIENIRSMGGFGRDVRYAD